MRLQTTRFAFICLLSCLLGPNEYDVSSHTWQTQCTIVPVTMSSAMDVTKTTMATTLAMEADHLLQDIRCAIRGLEDQVTGFEELTTRIFHHVSQTNPSIRKLANDKELMKALLVRAALTLGGRPRTPPTDPFDEATTTSSLNLRQCVVCQFKIHRRAAIHIYCGNHHVYCRECLHSAFELATRDVQYDPPRCCDHLISVNEVVNYLPRDLTAFYHAMEKQYIDSTMAENVSTGGGIDHEQYSKEQNDEPLIQLCSTQEWTTCPKCYQMVPLIQQCDRVQCQCGVVLNVHRSTSSVAVECDTAQHEMFDAAGQDQAVAQQEPGHGVREHGVGDPTSICSKQVSDAMLHQHRWEFAWSPKSTCYFCQGRLAFVQECEGCGIKTCARCRDKAGGVFRNRSKEREV